MSDDKVHSHPCVNRDRGTGCKNTVSCDDANLFHNYDGHPVVACREFHERENRYPCEECAERDVCTDCGRIEGLEPHDADCAVRMAEEAR